MFIDRVKIIVKAGNGGMGCNSLYTDKYTRYGIPDGGDGGKGADIILKASRNVYTLVDFQYHHEFIAPNGRHGSSNTKRGAAGKDWVVQVPLGTLVVDEKTNCLLEDMCKDGQELVVAKGGDGGKGNRTKKDATPGKKGEYKTLILDLKLIADVGIVGFPNAGKSTLITGVSSARPKIAAYPFTTIDPILGVVRKDDFTFTIVDIPGLIEGAHQGRGLGDQFLRHVERTKILVHIVDMAGVDTRDPLEDYVALNNELELYGKGVMDKVQVLVANKMDLDVAKDNLKRFKKKFKKKIIPISAKEKENLDALIDEIAKILQKNSR